MGIFKINEQTLTDAITDLSSALEDFNENYNRYLQMLSTIDEFDSEKYLIDLQQTHESFSEALEEGSITNTQEMIEALKVIESQVENLDLDNATALKGEK